MRVPLLDLKGQYATIRTETEDAIRRVVESQMFILGPEVKAFEEEIARFCTRPVRLVLGSAAERAGLKPGDIVLSFNGRPVADSGALAAMVGEAKPGDEAKLEILRKGDRRQLVATLGASSDESKQSARVGDEEEHAQLGLAVRPLTPEERKAADVPGGLVVEGVNGAAARAGVAPGDIVLQAGGKPVKSVEDLRAAAKSGKTVALLVQRGDRRLFVPLQAG